MRCRIGLGQAERLQIACGALRPANECSVVTFAITAFLNPAKVGYVGYWIDRLIFPHARPHELIGELIGIEAGTSRKRRAAVVSATILAAAFTP